MASNDPEDENKWRESACRGEPWPALPPRAPHSRLRHRAPISFLHNGSDRIESNRASMIGAARIKSILRIRLTIAPSSWEHNATPLSSPHILHAYYKCLSMLSLVVCSCLTSLSRVSTSSRFLFSLARCSVLALCNKVIIRMR